MSKSALKIQASDVWVRRLALPRAHWHRLPGMLVGGRVVPVNVSVCEIDLIDLQGICTAPATAICKSSQNLRCFDPVLHEKQLRCAHWADAFARELPVPVVVELVRGVLLKGREIVAGVARHCSVDAVHASIPRTNHRKGAAIPGVERRGRRLHAARSTPCISRPPVT
jgi:hypothetical protein